eukprot:gene7553-9287_t
MEKIEDKEQESSSTTNTTTTTTTISNKRDIENISTNNETNQPKLKYPKKIQIGGSDSDGGSYKNIDDLWVKELDKEAQNSSENKWYHLADEYWKSVDATVDGMLGGLSHIADIDVSTSKLFLSQFIQGKIKGREPMKLNRALDCGAGIGRVTKTFLIPMGFQSVDLVEQNLKFLDEAKNSMLKDENKVENYYGVGLQDFKFEQGRLYDCIWIQWVIGHLHDNDLIEFLNRCMDALAPNGIICIKDNTARKTFVMDKQDNSVTRTESHFKYLFEQSGCHLIKTLVQPGFPKDLFPVILYALERKK